MFPRIDCSENEVSATCAEDGEKSSDRLARLSGNRDRDWQTRAGSVALRIPRPRTGSYFPSFLEPRRSVERALTAVIQEAHVHGVSTRAIDDHAQAMGGTGISKSHVSGLHEESDERVNAFLIRPIEGEWRSPLSLRPMARQARPWINATYPKVRRKRSAGRLSTERPPFSASPSWVEFLRDPDQRGWREAGDQPSTA